MRWKKMRILKNTKGVWDWSKITVSLIVLVVVPLICLVYNNMDNTIIINRADAKDAVEKIEEEVALKVSEKSLMQYIAIQQQQTDMLKVDMTEQKIIDKETLKVLQNLNISVRLLEQKLKKE